MQVNQFPDMKLEYCEHNVSVKKLKTLSNLNLCMICYYYNLIDFLENDMPSFY